MCKGTQCRRLCMLSLLTWPVLPKSHKNESLATHKNHTLKSICMRQQMAFIFSVIHAYMGLPHWLGRHATPSFKDSFNFEEHSAGTASSPRPPLRYCKQDTREATSVAACRAKLVTSLSVFLACIFCSACIFSRGILVGSHLRFHWLCPMRYFC